MKFKKSRAIYPVLIAVLLALAVSAQGQNSSPPVDGKLKSLMHTFYTQIVNLRPYLVSEERMKDPKAVKEIDLALSEMIKKIQAPTPKTIDSTPSFRITYDLIGSHLEETKEVLSRGELEYTRMRLNATTNFCIHCHSQIPEKSKGMLGISGLESDLAAPTMENAEFLFIIRRFDQALARYDAMARLFPKSAVSSDQLHQLYHRKLAIFARVYRDPQKAVDNFIADLKNPALPKDIQKNIKAWVEYFEEWKREKVDPATLSDEKLVDFVAKSLPDGISRKISPANPDAVNYLRLSGLLFERLMKKPTSPSVPEMLYNLALSEKHVSTIYWYPMSEIYLKECIQKFPKRPITRKCFSAYEKAMQDRYLGGGPLPEQIRQSIEALKTNL